MPYYEYKDKVASVAVDGRKLGDLSHVSKSLMRDYIIVKILPVSYFS